MKTVWDHSMDNNSLAFMWLQNITLKYKSESLYWERFLNSDTYIYS